MSVGRNESPARIGTSQGQVPAGLLAQAQPDCTSAATLWSTLWLTLASSDETTLDTNSKVIFWIDFPCFSPVLGQDMTHS